MSSVSDRKSYLRKRNPTSRELLILLAGRKGSKNTTLQSRFIIKKAFARTTPSPLARSPPAYIGISEKKQSVASQ